MSKYSDMIEQLLTEKHRPTPYKPNLDDRIWTHWGMYVFLSVCGLGALWVLWDGVAERNTEKIVASTFVLIFCPFLLYGMVKTQEKIERMRLNELEFERQIILGRLQQNPTLVETLSKVDIERIRAKGMVSANELMWLRQMHEIKMTRDAEQFLREWEAEEAKKGRDHESFLTQLTHGFQSRESAKDRQQRTDELIAKHKHELEIMEKRIRSSVDVTADELAAYELEKAAMEAIEKEPDPDKKERMIRRLDKRLYR